MVDPCQNPGLANQCLDRFARMLNLLHRKFEFSKGDFIPSPPPLAQAPVGDKITFWGVRALVD